MSTRSRIAIEKQDGTVDSIYCHFDGYLSNNGEKLQNHYSTKEQLEQLIALGDISSLGNDVKETVAYHRDRGEDFNSKTYPNVATLFENGFDSGEEYVYCLTKDNRLLVSSGGPVADLQLALQGEDVL
jgi:hypothetical protein